MPLVPTRPAPVRDRGEAPESGRSLAWIRIGSVLLFLGLLAAAWQWTPLKSLVDLPRISAWIEPYRDAWYALPVVSAAYIVLGLFLFPVLLMILATGIAFGPWLGSLYALAGCLASASVGFAIGRWAGLRRVGKIAGPRVQRLSRSLERNGTLAVFVVRKVPAPYMLANIIVGASGVSYRDFLFGTLLGMGPMIIALAGFGFQLSRIAKEPTPAGIAAAAAFLILPVIPAVLVNRALKRRRRDL
jgi:phospholipase D1/2